MEYIAHLDLVMNQSLRGNRWCALASEIGTPFREYDGPANVASMIDFVRGATGLVLPDISFLAVPELLDNLRECVAAGRPLLVRVDPNSLDDLNPFLGFYGLEGTQLGVHDLAAAHPRLIEIMRSETPSAFHPHPLLDGVDELVIQQPNVIRFSGNATPILALPAGKNIELVDQTTDFPADWTSPELSCLVLSPIGNNGGVLALSCGLTHDPYVGPTGVQFPGISAGNNETLAKNILNWLAGKLLNPVPLAVTAFDLVDHIERCLVEFVFKRLKGECGDDWWNAIPLAIRKKCAERCEEEGNKMPKVAYLDLLDVHAILEKNWRSFGEDLAAVGWVGGKQSALSWFFDLNTVRKSVMHPVRRHFVPSLVDDTTVSKLTEWLSRVQRLGLGSGAVD